MKDKFYKFVMSGNFWPVVIFIATFIGGMLYYSNAQANSKSNFEYNYVVGKMDYRNIYEFKTETGSVCVLVTTGRYDSVALSCDFTANSHAK